MDSIENFLVSENLTFMSLMECKKTHSYPWNHFFVFRKKPEPPIWWVEPACCHAEQQLALWVYRLFQQVHSVAGPVCDLLSASGKT